MTRQVACVTFTLTAESFTSPWFRGPLFKPFSMRLAIDDPLTIAFEQNNAPFKREVIATQTDPGFPEMYFSDLALTHRKKELAKRTGKAARESGNPSPKKEPPPETDAGSEPETPADPGLTDSIDVLKDHGLGNFDLAPLHAAELETIGDLVELGVEGLVDLKGVGKTRAGKIDKAIQAFLMSQEE